MKTGSMARQGVRQARKYNTGLVVRYSEYNPWEALAVGLILIFSGVFKLVTNTGGDWHDVYIPVWTGWLFLPLGVIISILSIRSMRTWKEPEPPRYSDEEAAQAKAKLDRMHLREHGSLPEAPTREKVTSKTAPEPPTPEQNARIAKANTRIRQGFLLMLAGAAVFYTAGGALALIPAIVLFLVGLTRLAVGVVERA